MIKTEWRMSGPGRMEVLRPICGKAAWHIWFSHLRRVGEPDLILGSCFFQLRHKLFAELSHFWLNHYAAIGLIRVAFVIPLMIDLCRVESSELRHFGNNRIGPDLRGRDVGDGFFSGGLLLRRMIEDRGAILGADVGTLPVQSRRIVYGEEDIEQVLEGDYLRIERDLHNLGVAGFPGANILISRVGYLAARIT